MDFKDYYALLGVVPDADAKTIQQAYRRLARQHHPDVNPGNKTAEERFKVINEAYQALSNQDRRHQYDALRRHGQSRPHPGGREQAFDWQRWAARPGEQAPVRNAAPKTWEDIFGADSPFSELLCVVFGEGPAREQAARPRRGRDVEVEMEITLDEAFRGTTRLLQIEGRRVEVPIPPGVQTGSRIQLAGQGRPGSNHGGPGDLYVVVQVRLPHHFAREGDDLYTTLSVDIYTAILGGEARLPTLERPVILKIPPRTQADHTFRLRGKGMPRLGFPGQRGDLYVRVKLALPDSLSEREIQTIRELAAGQKV